MNTVLVMVVDDDSGTRDVLREILEEEGYDVAVASDGQDAAARLDDTRPQLVITDLEMPRVGGEALIERIKSSRPQLPILVITSRLVVDAQREAARLGVQGYLNKPIEIDALLEAVGSASVPA